MMMIASLLDTIVGLGTICTLGANAKPKIVVHTDNVP
jgi:hypothetical protein